MFFIKKEAKNFDSRARDQSTGAKLLIKFQCVIIQGEPNGLKDEGHRPKLNLISVGEKRDARFSQESNCFRKQISHYNGEYFSGL